MKSPNQFRKSLIFAVCIVILINFASVFGQQAKITIQTDKTGSRISPLLYGIFFEEINRAGDGGLYAEMVQNRSFEDADSPNAWSLVKSGDADAAIALDDTKPLNDKNPHCLKLQISKLGNGEAGVINEGFKGMNFKKGKEYTISLSARTDENYKGELKIELINQKDSIIASQSSGSLTGEWKQYKLKLTPSADCPAGKLKISATGAGTIYLDMVSLFAKDTWKGRANGLRTDLAEMLAGMKPSFVRFPGGCFVEGNRIENAFRWKKTIGDIAQRPGHWNLWGYRSTDGLGYHEYLQMCEDLNSEPLFVINCGMAHENHIPMDQMGEWAQDALDAIEYANGPVDSQWGAIRAKNGHPKPFNMKFIEIGNENGGPLYQERYDLFYDAIKKKYPDMKLVADVITTGKPTEIIDEHYYNSPEFFINNAARYDSYDRKGPKVYVGEYAVTQGCGQGNLRAAVGEAAFMTGMERNSDIVVMSSYAPLFVNVGWRQWNPDAINFDCSRVYGTPSYYVQKMFSEAVGDVTIPMEIEAPQIEPKAKAGQIGVGTWATQAEYKDIRIVQDGKEIFRSDFSQNMNAWRPVSGEWKIVDGALRQESGANDCRIMIKDLTVADCTIELKARKVSGAEGFLILFRTPNDQTKSWWNIGGWGNSRHAIESSGIAGRDVTGKIETGRWYDIRMELKGNTIKCYLDNKLIHDLKIPAQKALYAVASKSEKNGELIVKVVNVTDEPVETQINLAGLKNPPSSASVNLLTAPDSSAENSLDEPKKVYPKEQKINIGGKSFTHSFPAQSVSVIRLTAK